MRASDEDVAAVVADARAAARAKAAAILAEELTEALLAGARSRLAPPAPPPPDTGETGWYVFGVVREGALELGDDVLLLAAGGLAAAAREVPLAEYGEAALRENLEDIAWLEDAARRHEAVLEGVLAQTTVIPLRLCTIYSSEEAVRDMLAAERAELTEALDRLAGHTEWGVKGFSDGREPEVAEGEGSPGREGEAYLARKRARAQAGQRVRDAAEEAHARLAELADEALANPLQRRELTGRQEEMVLNGVYLVEDAREEAFRAAVGALAEEHAGLGLSFERTGPWPPYNFVKRSVEAAR